MGFVLKTAHGKWIKFEDFNHSCENIPKKNTARYIFILRRYRCINLCIYIHCTIRFDKMTNDFFMFWIFLLKRNKLLNHYIQATKNVSHIIWMYLLIEIFIIQFLLIIEWINLILVLLNFRNRTNIVGKGQWFMLRATKSNISV